MQSAPATLSAAEEPARPVPAAQEETRQKVAAEKARKKRVARERARARAMQEASAARQQEQTYYSYAPRPAYGPFQAGAGRLRRRLGRRLGQLVAARNATAVQ
jgi:hypothetical protein